MSHSEQRKKANQRNLLPCMVVFWYKKFKSPNKTSVLNFMFENSDFERIGELRSDWGRCSSQSTSGSDLEFYMDWIVALGGLVAGPLQQIEIV